MKKSWLVFVVLVLVGTVLCAVTPSGFWFTFGGGFRWGWGVPFKVAEVQGATPYLGDLEVRWLGWLKNLCFSAALFSAVYFSCYIWPRFRLGVILMSLLILYLLLHILVLHLRARTALPTQIDEQEMRREMARDRGERRDYLDD